MSLSLQIELACNWGYCEESFQHTVNDIFLFSIIFSYCKLQRATKVAETLLGKDAFWSILKDFVLLYLHLAFILWNPQTPYSMLCRRCGLCSRRNRKINIVLGEGGKMCPRCSKIKFYYQVSWHFCHSLQFQPNTKDVNIWPYCVAL